MQYVFCFVLFFLLVVLHLDGHMKIKLNSYLMKFDLHIFRIQTYSS